MNKQPEGENKMSEEEDFVMRWDEAYPARIIVERNQWKVLSEGWLQDGATFTRWSCDV